MPRLTLEELRKLRESARMDIVRREVEGKEIQVIVAMGTCGIAAGAKEILDTFLGSLDNYPENRLVETVMIRQTGCMGFCNAEPSVEVAVPGMPPVIYGKVNSALAKEIIEKHIIGKQLLENHILERPSVDNGAAAAASM